MCSSGVVRVGHLLYVCGCWDTPSPGPFELGYVSLIYVYIMAIINSLAIGKSKKSAGNLTYKTVRGRTIASQRITENKSNTPAQGIQRGRFGTTAQCIQLFLPYVNNFFEKTKFGSSRNQYVRVNKYINLLGQYGEVKEGIVPLSEAFLMLFDRDSSDKLLEGSAYFASYGTLACIVSETSTSGDTASIGVSDRKFMCNKNVLFTFTTAPKRDSIKLKSYLINLTTGVDFPKATPVYKEYTLSDDDISALAALGYKITVTEVEGVVSSLNIEAVVPSEDSPCLNSVGIIVPSVSGRIPTLLNIMQVQNVEPLP